MKNLVACDRTAAVRWCAVIIVCIAASAAIGKDGEKSKPGRYRGLPRQRTCGLSIPRRPCVPSRRRG